jgi:hypothetical protein
MNRLLSILVLAVLSLGLKAQGLQTTTLKPSADILVLKETSFDFGKIPQGKPVTHEFVLVNAGKDTLKLENVQASCGCTTPVWKKDPVTPGETTNINVGYNALADGPFEKTVTIYYNGGQIKTVTIKGTVYKTPATSAPQNASLELIKQ